MTSRIFNFLVIEVDCDYFFEELRNGLSKFGHHIETLKINSSAHDKPEENELIKKEFRTFESFTQNARWLKEHALNQFPDWNGDAVIFRAGALSPVMLKSLYPNSKLIGWFGILWQTTHFPESVGKLTNHDRLQQKIDRATALIELEACDLQVFESPSGLSKIPSQYSTSCVALWPLIDSTLSNCQPLKIGATPSQGLSLLYLAGSDADMAFYEKVAEFTNLEIVNTTISLNWHTADQLVHSDSIAVLLGPDCAYRASEAFALLCHGRSIVGPDLNWIRQWITHGESGMVYAPLSPSSAASAINRLACDSSLLSRLQMTNKESLATTDNDRAVRKFLHFIEALLA